MPTSSVPLSHAAKNALPDPLIGCAQEKKLSAFDYAQMCLALVSVARRIHELKTVKTNLLHRRNEHEEICPKT